MISGKKVITSFVATVVILLTSCNSAARIVGTQIGRRADQDVPEKIAPAVTSPAVTVPVENPTTQNATTTTDPLAQLIATQIRRNGVGVLFINPNDPLSGRSIQQFLAKNRMSPLDINIRLNDQQMRAIQNVLYCTGKGSTSLVLSADGGQIGLILNNYPTSSDCLNQLAGVIGQLSQPAHNATVNSGKPSLLELYSDGQYTVLVATQMP
jgi:hypothetical protein